MNDVKLIFGTMTIGEQIFGKNATEIIKYCVDNGIEELDTAYVYNEGECERIIGKSLKELGYPEIKVSTKVNPRISGKLDYDAAVTQLNESLERLGIKKADTFYLHFPDRNTPVDSVLEACNMLYNEGKFKELGLSNFPAELVCEVYEKCKERGFLLPTVYEGLYNPLSRKAEDELFETLRNLNIRFYAYNPLAGGLLTNKYSSFEDSPEKGRFTYRPNYQNRYWKKSFFEASDLLKEVCKCEGISIIEATYRWLMYHSALSRGDAIIIGASSLSQLEQNIRASQKGPLSEKFIDAFEKAWEKTKLDAPEYFKFYSASEKR